MHCSDLLVTVVTIQSAALIPVPENVVLLKQIQKLFIHVDAELRKMIDTQ